MNHNDIIKNAEIYNEEIIKNSAGQPIVYREVSKRPVKCKLFHKKIEIETPFGKSKIKKYFRCDSCQIVWFNFKRIFGKK